MAVVATFRADFTDFMKKAQAAEGSLDELQKAAGVTSQTVSRVGNSFSGESIIRQASAAALAIEEIGGSSRLTESEMARVNRTTGEAMAKLKALGLEVPPQIQKLYNETTRAADAVDELGQQSSTTSKITQAFTGAIGQMATALSISALIDRTVGAVADFASAAVESAGALTDLRNKTGLSLSLLQEMQVVAEQTGTSIDVFTNASYQLGLRLASNTDTLAELGLAYEELRNLTPDEQFRKVMYALEGVDNVQERARLGAELYGSKVYKEIAPAVSEGWRNITNEINKSNDAQLEAIDRASDRYTQFKRDVTTAFQGVIGNYFLARDELKNLTDSQRQQFVMLQRAGLDANGYLIQLSQERAAAEKAAQPVEQKRTEIARDYVRELAAQTEKVKALTPATIEQIDAARRLGANEEDLIRQFGVSAITLKLLADQKKESTKDTAAYEAQVKKAREEQQKFEASVKSLAGNFVELKPAVTDAGAALQFVARGYNDDGTLLNQTLHETAQATKDAAKETADWAQKTGAVLMPSIQANRAKVDESAAATVNWRGTVQTLTQAFAQLAQIGGPLEGVVGWMGQFIARINATQAGTDQLKSAFATIKAGGENTGQAVAQAATSLIGLSAAFIQGVSTGDTFTRTLNGMQQGMQIGSMFGPWGAAIGAAAGALTGLIAGLGSVSEEVKKARASVADFQSKLAESATETQRNEAAGRDWALTLIQTRDAFLAIGRTSAEAEAVVKRLLNTDDPKASAAALAEINQALAQAGKLAEEAKKRTEEWNKQFSDVMKEANDLGVVLPQALRDSITEMIDLGQITGEQADLFKALTGDNKNNFKAMEEAAKKYGVELGALGPAFAQNKINERAGEIISAFGTMTRGGADVAGVINGMSDEINQFIADALKSGQQVPENMRPILQSMIDQGRLTDENGRKLTDMGRLNFGAPIETAFDRIARKIEELVDALKNNFRGGLERAAGDAVLFKDYVNGVFGQIERDIQVNVQGHVDPGDRPGGNPPEFARGTKHSTWFRNFGSGTRAILHGDEAVVPRGMVGEFMRDVGGDVAPGSAAHGGTAAFEAPGALDELRALRSDMMTLPQQLARAVRDAILVAA